jgi:VWFA-related protein
MTQHGRRTWSSVFVTVAIAVAALDSVVAQQPTFRSRRDIVRIDVLVTAGNKPLLGLQPADFEILDDGVPQHLDLMSFEDMPINAVLALDLSGSVTGARLNQLRRGGRALVDGLRKGDRAALVGFSQHVDLLDPLTDNLAGVVAALDRAPTGGGTALFDASCTGIVLSESDERRSMLLVFSDGSDTSSWLREEDVVDMARRTSVVAYGVAVKQHPLLARTNPFRVGAERAFGSPVDDPHPAFLQALSDLTGGALIEVEPTGSLEGVFATIVKEFRQRYLLSFTPASAGKTGWHRLEVRIAGSKGRNTKVRARQGYVAGSGQ